MSIIIPATIPSIWETDLVAADRLGELITADGTPGTLGSYAIVIAKTTHPTYGVLVMIRDVAVSATDTSTLVNLAFGPKGGGNEEVIWPNLNAWGAPNENDVGARIYHFPGLYVPGDVAVSANCQSVIASKTCRVSVWLGQEAPNDFIAGKVQDYGADTGSASHGTSVASAADAWPATWTAVGSVTVRDHRIWTFGLDNLADTSIGASSLPHLVEIGFGPNNTNVTRIGGTFIVFFTSGESAGSVYPPYAYAPVPRGTQLFARISVDTGTEPRGVIIWGMD